MLIVFPKTVALPCTVPAAVIPVCTELIRYFAVTLPVVLIELLPNDPNNVTTFESPYEPTLPPDTVVQLNTLLPFVVNTCPLLPPIIVTLPTGPKLLVPVTFNPALMLIVFADIILAPEIFPPAPVPAIKLAALKLPLKFAVPATLIPEPVTTDNKVYLSLVTKTTREKLVN